MLGRLVTKVFWWLLTRGWLPDSILRYPEEINTFGAFFRWRIRQGLGGLMAKMDKEANDYGAR